MYGEFFTDVSGGSRPLTGGGGGEAAWRGHWEGGSACLVPGLWASDPSEVICLGCPECVNVPPQ